MQYKILYRGHHQPLPFGQAMRSRNRRNGNNHNALNYPLIRGYEYFGAKTPKMRAIIDHRWGGNRFSGDRNTFPGSPYIALTPSYEYTKQYGSVIYQVRIPTDKWQMYGVDDAVTFLKLHSIPDVAPANLGPSTAPVEALYGDTIPFDWIERID